MSKSKSTANLLIAILLIVALCVTVFLGIPFLKIGKLVDINRSTEFDGGYEMLLTVTAKDAEDKTVGDPALAGETLAQLQRRASHFGYDDVTVTDNGDGTLCFRTPNTITAKPDELALQLCQEGVITLTNSSSEEILSSDMLKGATVGYGQLSENAEASYYIQITLLDSAVADFAEATSILASQDTSADPYANVLYINVDGSPILQATVSESLAQNTFVISGSFEDANLPNLYAEYINGGVLPASVTAGEATEFSPLLPNAFLLIWLAFLALVVCGALCLIFAYRLGGVAVLSLTTVYLLFSALLYQVTGLRFSLFSILGLLLGLLILWFTSAKLFGNIKKEFASGKPSSSALRTGLQKSNAFYMIFHIVMLVITSALWILTSELGLAATGLTFLGEIAITLFFGNLFSFVFTYWNAHYWTSIFSGYGVREAKAYGAKAPDSDR